jgi:hypothetical protein
MKPKISKKKHLKILKKYFKINSFFYITLLICLFILSLKYTKSLIYLIICFIIISCYGYFTHILSHSFSVTKLYNSHDTILKKIYPINLLIQKYCDIHDFHHEIHHNTSINNLFVYQLLEGLNNMLYQSIILIICKYILIFLDNKIIIFWGLFYTTFHIINISINKSQVHKEHHINCNTNLGIEFYDILMGTKYNWKNIECHNSGSINIIILTLIFYIFV